MSHSTPSSSAPSTASNSASSPAAWPSVRLRPSLRGPPPVAVHHRGDVLGHPPEVDAVEGARRRPAPARRPVPGDRRCSGGVMGRRRYRSAAPPPETVVGMSGGRDRPGDEVATGRSARSVQARVGELGGGFLASAVTLALFLSLFPMLLVAIAVLGFLSAGDSSLANDLVSDLGLTGDAATVVTRASTPPRTAAAAPRSSASSASSGPRWASSAPSSTCATGPGRSRAAGCSAS